MGKGMEIDTFTILGIEPVSAFQMLSHLSTLPLKTLKNNFWCIKQRGHISKACSREGSEAQKPVCWVTLCEV